jgi:hypothetical protein
MATSEEDVLCDLSKDIVDQNCANRQFAAHGAAASWGQPWSRRSGLLRIRSQWKNASLVTTTVNASLT